MATAFSTLPTTELEAVNSLLDAVDEASVNTLSGTQTPDVAAAIRVLSEENRKLQTTGWHFNTDFYVTLTRDSNNKIPLGSAILSVYSPSMNVTIRGGFLYDRDNRTFVFTQSITDAITVTLLEFTQLPQAARTYIIEAAKEVFQQETVGQVSADKENKKTKMDAWSALINDEAKASGANLSTGTNNNFQMLRRDRLVQ